MNKISYLYYMYLYKVTYKLWMFFSRISRSYGIALMYHYVTDEDVDTIDSCKCKVGAFAKTLIKMIDEGYVFVSVEQSLLYLKERKKIKYALVTFDDVPECVYTNALPILERLQIPFILFVTTDYIDKPGYISTVQLEEMDKNPLCTVGAHTTTHPMLKHIKNSREEMYDSKVFLEKLLSHPIDYMAYPYGLQNTVSVKVMKQAKRIGYKCAFGTIQTPISDFSKYTLYYLPRIVRN